MREQKQRRSEGGITLIALVVTIIILLILAGVTLGMVLSDGGLIDKTKESISEHERAQEKEQEELGKAAGMMQNLIDGLGNTGGTTPVIPPTTNIPKEMQVGDIVNYTPDTTKSYELTVDESGYPSNKTLTQQSYTWKVLSINDNSVDIMGVPESEMPEVNFRGPTGYNNGVYFLNEMCKTLYSNSELKAEARSIELEDIESKMNDTGKGKINEYTTSSGVQYGETKEYTGSNAWYPNLAKYENHMGIDTDSVNSKGIGESEDGTKLIGQITIPLLETDWTTSSIGGYTNSKTQANSKITVKQTSYSISQNKDYYDDERFYSLVFGIDINYWLATRYSNCTSNSATFGLRIAGKNKIQGSLFFDSDRIV